MKGYEIKLLLFRHLVNFASQGPAKSGHVIAFRLDVATTAHHSCAMLSACYNYRGASAFNEDFYTIPHDYSLSPAARSVCAINSGR